MYDSNCWFWLKGKKLTTLDAILSPKYVFFLISNGEGGYISATPLWIRDWCAWQLSDLLTPTHTILILPKVVYFFRRICTNWPPCSFNTLKHRANKKHQLTLKQPHRVLKVHFIPTKATSYFPKQHWRVTLHKEVLGCLLRLWNVFKIIDVGFKLQGRSMT